MQQAVLMAHVDYAARLSQLLEAPIGMESAAIGLTVAFACGAAHALAPGHGKTLVSAYLIGSKGTPQQAILLGLTTSITHTLAIYLLGCLALFASQYVVPEHLYPLFSVVSGLAICGVGIQLVLRRLNSAHHHSHDSSQIEGDRRHSHHDSCCQHTDASQSPSSLGALLTMGISSGLTPCPSALVLLLSAVALHRIPYGLVLVGGFSVGLAFVLTALGLLAVYAGQWLDRLPTANRWVRRLPLASAVATVGLGLSFTAVSSLTAFSSFTGLAASVTLP